MTTEPNPNAKTAAAAPANGKRKKALLGLLSVAIVAGLGWAAWYLLVARFHEDTDDAYVQGNVVSIVPQTVGTVVGIVSAFHMMGVSGQGGLGTVSAGIAEALVATALGILVAIPALWLFNHLTQRIQRLLAELECVAEELAVAALLENGRSGTRPLHLVRQ